jgi:hypothetical protein
MSLERLIPHGPEGYVAGMLWVTRAGGNVDRVACPWLIKRFIDPDAQFLFVPADKVLETATMLGGKSYDAKGADYGHVRGA